MAWRSVRWSRLATGVFGSVPSHPIQSHKTQDIKYNLALLRQFSVAPGRRCPSAACRDRTCPVYGPVAQARLLHTAVGGWVPDCRGHEEHTVVFAVAVAATLVGSAWALRSRAWRSMGRNAGHGAKGQI